ARTAMDVRAYIVAASRTSLCATSRLYTRLFTHEDRDLQRQRRQWAAAAARRMARRDAARRRLPAGDQDRRYEVSGERDRRCRLQRDLAWPARASRRGD